MAQEAKEIVLSPEKINIGGVPGYTKADMDALQKDPQNLLLVPATVLAAMIETVEKNPDYYKAALGEDYQDTLEKALGIVREDGKIVSANIGWMVYAHGDEQIQEPVAVFQRPEKMPADMAINLVQSVVQKLEQASSTVVLPNGTSQKTHESALPQLTRTSSAQITIPVQGITSLDVNRTMEFMKHWQQAVKKNTSDREAAGAPKVKLTLGIQVENGPPVVIKMIGERNPGRDPKDSEQHADTPEQAHALAEEIWQQTIRDTCKLFVKSLNEEKLIANDTNIEVAFVPVETARLTMSKPPKEYTRGRPLRELVSAIDSLKIEPLPEGLKGQEFYLARHLESLTQISSKGLGGDDNTPLSRKGEKRQGMELRSIVEQIEGLGPTITSGTKRTDETARIATAGKHPIHQHPGIKDWILGKATALEPKSKYIDAATAAGVDLPEYLKQDPPRPGKSYPSEPWSAYCKRSNDALMVALDAHKEEQGIPLVVAHQVTPDAVLAPLGYKLEKSLRNGQVLHFKPKKDKGDIPWEITVVERNIATGLLMETPIALLKIPSIEERKEQILQELLPIDKSGTDPTQFFRDAAARKNTTRKQRIIDEQGRGDNTSLPGR